MMQILILLFIAIPVIEIYCFIQIGSMIGAGTTILVVIVTAILGAYLLKQQGLSTFARAQKSLSQNSLPATEMLEGLILLISGAFLLTPGFFTDTIGFLCLIPAVRQFLVKKMLKNFNVIQSAGSFGFNSSNNQTKPNSRTIEGEYWKDDENQK